MTDAVLASTPKWWPARWYYGWAQVGVLGLTATVSYGILQYGFSVFIAPMTLGLGWSKTQVTGAFSVAQFVAGAAAIPVGRWVDAHGARALMSCGSLLAALVLVGWAHVTTLPLFYLLMSVLGVALAAVLYEPAFAVITTWFRRGRSRALTVLTFMGGLASVIFVPLIAALVARLGWRQALDILAIVMVVASAVPHALILRRRPGDFGLLVDGAPSSASPGATAMRAHLPAEESVRAEEAFGSREFRWVAVAFALSGFTTTTISVHLVPLLLERGYSIEFAGTAMGVLGLMALPGRLVFTPLGARVSRWAVTASIFAMQAVATAVLLLGTGRLAIWAFVLLFGAGFGAITPARAALVADSFGPANYGRIGGALALIVSLARAAAPVGASVIYSAARATRGYDVVLTILLSLCLLSGLALLLAGTASASPQWERQPHLP